MADQNLPPPPPPDPNTVTLGNGATLTYSILNGYVTIDNPGDTVITVNGNCDLYVDGIVNEVVTGDLNVQVHGNYNLTVAGSVTEVVTGNIASSAASVGLTVTNYELTAASKLETISENVAHNVGGQYLVTANELQLTAAGLTNITTTDLTITVNGLHKEQSDTRQNVVNGDYDHVVFGLLHTLASEYHTIIDNNYRLRVGKSVMLCFMQNYRAHIRGRSKTTSLGLDFEYTAELDYPCSIEVDTSSIEFPEVNRAPHWPGVTDGQPEDEEL